MDIRMKLAFSTTEITEYLFKIPLSLKKARYLGCSKVIQYHVAAPIGLG